jgi:TRAP-type transport system periplasmic protein
MENKPVRRCSMKRRFSWWIVLFIVPCVLSAVTVVHGAATKPVELRLMHFAPIDHLMHKDVFVPWAKMVEERTAGEIKVEIFPGQLLGKVTDTYDATVTGTADISWAYMNASPGRFPLHSVYELPFLFSDVKVGNRVIWEHFEKEPALRAEFEEVKVLWLHVIPLMQFHTATKPIRSFNDLKGMKIRTPMGLASKVIKAFEAVPVTMSLTDAYVAMERGTVDGTVVPWATLFSFKFNEVTKYHTEVNLWSAPHFVIMNKKRWESLSSDVKKVIEGLSGAWAADFTGRVDEKYDVEARKKLEQAKGHEMISLSSEEIGKGKKILKPIWDEWVSEKESKGLPGRRILDETIRLGEKHSR